MLVILITSEPVFILDYNERAFVYDCIRLTPANLSPSSRNCFFVLCFALRGKILFYERLSGMGLEKRSLSDAKRHLFMKRGKFFYLR